MNFKQLAEQKIDELSGKIPEKVLLENIDNDFVDIVLDEIDETKVDENENLELDLTEDEVIDIEIEDNIEPETIKLFDGYLGEQKEIPNPLDYGPNATYRNLREGIVYKKNSENLWEAFLKDGQNGRNGQSAPGGGCGVEEVKKLISENVVPSQTSTSKIFLDRPLRVASFGDSTAALGFSTTNSENLIRTFTSANQTVSLNGSTGLLYGRLPIKYVADGGIGSQTLINMINRISATSSDTRKSTSDVINLNPDVVFLHAGSFNDIFIYGTTQLSSATSASFMDRLFNQHKTLVEIFTSYGITVIDSGTFGYGGVAATGDWIKSAIYNSNQRNKAAAVSNDKWIYIDVDGVVSNFGEYISGMSYDGIHLSQIGARNLADKEEIEIRKLYNIVPKHIQVYDNLKNFNTTATTPANHTFSYTGITLLSASTSANKYTSTFDVTATSNNLTVWFTNSVFDFIQSGTNYYLSPKYKIFDSNGNIIDNETNYNYRIRMSNGSVYIQYNETSASQRGDCDRIIIPYASSVPWATINTGGTQFNIIPIDKIPLGRYSIEWYPTIFGVSI